MVVAIHQPPEIPLGRGAVEQIGQRDGAAFQLVPQLELPGTQAAAAGIERTLPQGELPAMRHHLLARLLRPEHL